MHPALFLQSELQDPYAFYKIMRNENPVYWDEKNNLWAIYSYRDCIEVLQNVAVHIPSVDKNGLNEYAMSITDQLVRLNNGNQHTIARDAVTLLTGKMKAIPIENIMTGLITTAEIDWVDAVCKKIPVITILKGFDFNDADTTLIATKTTQLIKIMLSHKTQEQLEIINEISTAVYNIVEKHLLITGMFNDEIVRLTDKYLISKEKALAFFVSNLIGLVIQSYDAGRGILSNSLLQLLNMKDLITPGLFSKASIEKIITETLRFDPPVQNTRRIATSTILLNNIEIKKEETILLVLAAANRDPAKFINADVFDRERENNNEHLTFGFGNHMCIARHFSVAMATMALTWLFTNFKKITLLEKEIAYEPLVNVRLPERILIVAQR